MRSRLRVGDLDQRKHVFRMVKGGDGFREPARAMPRAGPRGRQAHGGALPGRPLGQEPGKAARRNPKVGGDVRARRVTGGDGGGTGMSSGWLSIVAEMC